MTTWSDIREAMAHDGITLTSMAHGARLMDQAGLSDAEKQKGYADMRVWFQGVTEDQVLSGEKGRGKAWK